MDRLRYLNGQISNDARKATDTLAIHACVLNAKGKISADVFVRADGESFLVDSDADREHLIQRLERYVIADDVVIDDVTDEFALFHVLGEPSGNAAVVQAERYGATGEDIWVSRAEHDAVEQGLRTRVSLCDAECEEVFRIERGIPRWARDLTEEIIPTEANLESSAIDYAKGCYIGQEVISRIKMSGQTNKRLCGLITTSETALATGTRLFINEKDVGWITSATRSARVGSQIALGFVKRGYEAVGTQLVARTESGEVFVQITALPFI